MNFQWTDSFAALGPAFYTRLTPTPLPQTRWLTHSKSLAAELGLSEEWLASGDALQAFSGNALLSGSQPLASVYSGHQFGQWAGQLGDGRAILLGGLHTPIGEMELQLKGAGATPYSRMGDGRAVLRSSIREFLCSEAMHGLGIPTTRALSLVGSKAPVRRETMETAAVVARVAPSFVRFGHFEHFAFGGLHAELRQLADHVIARFYPNCLDATHPYAALLEAVANRTAELMAQWQAVGFCHGVMNTDNMSILGLTIDYGPFGFLDGFDVRHICNYTDTQGRYAYGQQPNIAYWNLFCLGQALLPLIGDQDRAVAALEPYKTIFPQALQRRLSAKLGFESSALAPKDLVDGILKLLQQEKTDWTLFWRRFSRPSTRSAARDLMIDRDAFDTWMLSYLEQTKAVDVGQSANLMLKTNPSHVLRNHLAQKAIEQAEAGDLAELHALQTALQNPFDDLPAHHPYTALPPDWAKGLEVSCSS